MTNQIKYINKALSMNVIKQQIQITINKTELNTLISEALANPESAAAIKRVLAPALAGSFPQFPDFTNISIGETEEDGSTVVVLKVPRQAVPKSDAPIGSMDPLEVNEPVDESDEPVDEPTMEPAHVDPLGN